MKKEPNNLYTPQPIPSFVKAAKEKLQKEATLKLTNLTIEYFRVAKDDSFGAQHHFDRYENQWKLYATLKNKQQRDLKLSMDAFKKQVDFMIEHAQNLLRQQQEEKQKSESDGI